MQSSNTRQLINPHKYKMFCFFFNFILFLSSVFPTEHMIITKEVLFLWILGEYMYTHQLSAATVLYVLVALCLWKEKEVVQLESSSYNRYCTCKMHHKSGS